MKMTARRLTDRPTQGLAAEISVFFKDLAGSLFDSYRPELHYMRGPGPKWHAKHDSVAGSYQLPGLVPVRVKR